MFDTKRSIESKSSRSRRWRFASPALVLLFLAAQHGANAAEGTFSTAAGFFGPGTADSSFEPPGENDRSKTLI